MNTYSKLSLTALALLFLGAFDCLAQIPANPFSPNSPWNEGHGTYCQQNTAQASFTKAEQFTIEKIVLDKTDDGFSPSGTMVSEKYPSGAYVCWATNAMNIYKVVIDGTKTSIVKADKRKIGFKVVSGYWVMDRSNTFFFMSDWKIFVLKDANQSDPYSAIICEKVIDAAELKSSAGFDFMIGMKMLYNGMIAITTRGGKLAYFDTKQRKIIDVIDLGEKIQNNMAVEEGNFLYLNTNSGTYKYVGNEQKLTKVWFAPTDKSGSTPTLLNVNEDKLLLVTNEVEPYQLFALWRDAIPENWQGIAGYDKRVAAVIKLDFGLGAKGKIAPTENSLLVFGATIFTANWTGLWPNLKANNSGIAAYDWNSQANKFVPKWQNPSIALPNSMQALSVASQVVYAVGRKSDDKVWIFEGIDWNTGKSLFSVPLGAEAVNNVTGSGIQIAWDGDIIFMAPKAVFRIKKK